jgi:hypothetical protein
MAACHSGNSEITSWHGAVVMPGRPRIRALIISEELMMCRLACTGRLIWPVSSVVD